MNNLTEKSTELAKVGIPFTCLHHIYQDAADKYPDRLAVSSPDSAMTYLQLEQCSNALAHHLVALGVGPESLVGLYMGRNVEMIVAILAILKAGGAYVPIDPAYASQRTRIILEDSAVTHVITKKALTTSLATQDLNVIFLEHHDDYCTKYALSPPQSEVASDNAAYVIYTSGTTGTPKGVLVEHRNVIALFENTKDVFQFNSDDVWTLFHSVGFDFSVWEIWGALLHGGELFIVPDNIARAPAELMSVLAEKKVTVLNQTPTNFQQLIRVISKETETPSLSLRYVIFGGERLNTSILAEWMNRFGDETPTLINMYGITETTIHVTHRVVSISDTQNGKDSPIGAAIPGYQLAVLNDHGETVDDGSPGNLYVGGSGVTRGYINQPELTRARFQKGLSGSEGILYNTGDVVTKTGAEEYLYCGRNDDQIKVRGYRIEPGEIETRLKKCPSVSELIVVPRDYGEGDVRLLAYFILNDNSDSELHQSETVTALENYAKQHLPHYMRPSKYKCITEVPRTSHGKIDVNKLLDIERHSNEPDASDKNSENVEAKVLNIWQSVLERTISDKNLDFFDLGGTSLALTRIIDKIDSTFDFQLDISQIIDHVSISRMVDVINENTGKSELIEVESLVKGAWQEILGKDDINPDDDFFDIGGTSLALTRLLDVLESKTGISIDIVSIIDDVSITRMSSQLSFQ